jgi:probable rRNA maturation factor
MTALIDISISSPLWRKPRHLRRLAEACVREACAATGRVIPSGTELSLVLADDEQIRALNRRWRHIDAPTNVLAFPAATSKAALLPCLGDIVVAHETLAREATDAAKPFDHHFCHLIVHGFLHLIGYDHDEPTQAELMEAMERAALARLAIADPYREALLEAPSP